MRFEMPSAWGHFGLVRSERTSSVKTGATHLKRHSKAYQVLHGRGSAYEFDLLPSSIVYNHHITSAIPKDVS